MDVDAARTFAERLRGMGARGESAYAIDGEDTHDIPAQACAGRAGMGKTFSGTINLATGEIRINCAEELPFWLRIDLGECPFWRAAPGGVEADAAARDFAERASGKRKREVDPTHEDSEDPEIRARRDEVERRRRTHAAVTEG